MSTSVPPPNRLPETDSYAGSSFHQLGTFFSRYAPHHNGPSIADWPKRSNSLWKSYLVDWLIVLLMLVFLAIWFVEPPEYFFRLDDRSISYPQIPESIGSTPIVLMITLGPVLIIGLAQIWVRDLRDFHQASMAALQIFVVTQVICMFTWLLVGGPRPSFLDVCQPDTSQAPSYIVPGGHAYYSDKICTCSHHDLVKAKHSLPSDHAASAFACAIFLTIYISSKIKLFDNKSHFWKIIPFCVFMVLALWISFSRLHDNRHRFEDIIVGIVIGAIVAPIIYRLNFCSLWGPDNHIPTRFTWGGKYLTWRGKHREPTLPVTVGDNKDFKTYNYNYDGSAANGVVDPRINNFNPVVAHNPETNVHNGLPPPRNTGDSAM